jgi:hypothetical protein
VCEVWKQSWVMEAILKMRSLKCFDQTKHPRLFKKHLPERLHSRG